jgi:hypothetical protein
MYLETFSSFGFDYKHFSNGVKFFQVEEKSFFFETCATLLHKQLLANETNICYLHIHYALRKILKFNFWLLFDFIIFF